jgi:radical SAM enzyme (TIGR01210 family)
MIREPALVEWHPARIRGRPGHRLMVVLAAPGCAYAARTGGCTNCSFPAAFGAGSPVSIAEYEAQMEVAARRIPASAGGPIRVELFVSGSFFNEEEVPAEAQSLLAERAATIPGVTDVLVETRPEYATDAALVRAREAAGSRFLEVAIGLESADAEIRERRIRKGFGWTDFEAAATAVARAGAGLMAYVLLKPIDTPEREAVDDAIRTCSAVFALGRRLAMPARVAVQPCFVGPGTILFDAFQAGRYRPPWLWSVVEVLRATAALGPIEVGLSDEGLNPARVPANCERCSAGVRSSLAAFDRTGDASVLDGLDCACRADWIAETGFRP